MTDPVHNKALVGKRLRLAVAAAEIGMTPIQIARALEVRIDTVRRALMPARRPWVTTQEIALWRQQRAAGLTVVENAGMAGRCMDTVARYVKEATNG